MMSPIAIFCSIGLLLLLPVRIHSGTTFITSCDPPKFQCWDRSACLSTDLVCNGSPECDDDSDETPAICQDAVVFSAASRMSRAKRFIYGGGCYLPETPMHGSYTVSVCKTAAYHPACSIGYSSVIKMSKDSTLEYNCNAGYKLHGPAIVTCASGKWEPSIPKCKFVKPTTTTTTTTARTTTTVATTTTRTVSTARPGVPPYIVKQPPADGLLFQVAKNPDEDARPFIIECEADGDPYPTYKWTKNGKPFNWIKYDDRFSQQPGRATLVVTQPRDEDEGYYQCFAQNEWGIATSNSAFVRKSELNSFVDQPPIVSVAQEGEPYKVVCEPPDGWPKPEVVWVIQSANGALRSINSSRITVDPEGTLWFSSVTLQDQSDDFVYACAANSRFRNEYKLGNKVKLQVVATDVSSDQNKHGPVEQYVSRSNVEGRRRQKVELWCIYGGTPVPEIRWTKKGGVLPYKRATYKNYGKTLVLNNIDLEDEGTYECEASNGVDAAKSHSVELTVTAAPRFTVIPESQNAAEGETIEFHCEADGVPQPEIKWIHNGVRIQYAPPNPRRRVLRNKIVIERLEKRDIGNYGCNATNENGYVYKDVYVNVLALPPKIMEGVRDTSTVTGKSVDLTCRVFGAPKPYVKWLRDGLELVGERYTILQNGDLRITDVSKDDSGEYTCYAINKLGSVSASGILTVQGGTRIIDWPVDSEVAAGKKATFRCNAVTDSTLTLTIDWLRDGQPIDFDAEPRFVKMVDQSLVITRTAELDTGKYTCRARTEYDEVSSTATLIVQDVPNRPDLTNTMCYDHDATVAWRPMGDNRSPIISYTIQQSTRHSPDTWEVVADNVPAYENSYKIITNIPWEKYSFRVIAYNKIGPSMPSEKSDICDTPPTIPFKNPDNVKGEGTTPTNLVISWTPMPEKDHNGPQFKYRVFWKKDLSDEEWQFQDIYDWKVSQTTIENQPTYQRYLVKVMAMNEVGESNMAPAEVIGYSGKEAATSTPSSGSVSPLPSPPPPRVTSVTSACPKGWEFFKDFCYYISDFRTSWQMARQVCKETDKRADLVSLRDVEEQHFFTRKMFWQVWIGLNDLDHDNKWIWADGSSSEYRNWGRNEPNSIGSEHCVELTQSQKWNNRNCSAELNYVCKLQSESGTCPDDWDYHLQSCYIMSSKKDTWFSARAQCKKLHPLADLATIDIPEEQLYLTEQMYWQLWIGLNNLEDINKWEWTDDSVANFINWREGEPNYLKEERCVELQHTEKWSNKRCGMEMKFACQVKPLDPCKEGWVYEGDSCYYISEERLTWKQSREACKSRDGKSDLVSLHKASEQEFITDQMYWELWIGYNLQSTGDTEKWAWSDNSDTSYRPGKFDPKENHRCSVLIHSGKWSSRECQGKFRFVCKMQPDLPSCPTDEWEFYVGYCFYLSKEKTTWEKARQFCRELDSKGDLVSIHSFEEQKYLLNRMIWRLWIGLNDLENNGQWEWTDDTPTNFISWREAPTKIPEEKCVELYTTGVWSNIRCETELNYACRVQPDPCPVGWHYLLDACYYISEFKTMWKEARDLCKETFDKADLVSINRAEDNFFLARKFLHKSVWIGLNDLDSPGVWKWSTNKPAEFFHWDPADLENEEENSKNNCAELVHSGGEGKAAVKWAKKSCTEQNYFICKFRADFSDICPEGWEYHSIFCYYTSYYQLDWFSAREACKQMDTRSDLLYLESLQEEEHFTNKMILRVWIGLNNRTDGDKWTWSDGSAVNYLQWNQSEPNNLVTEKCVEMTIDGGGTWNNDDCSTSLHFMCRLPLVAEGEEEVSEFEDIFPTHYENHCPPIRSSPDTNVRCTSPKTVMSEDGETTLRPFMVTAECGNWLPPGSEAHFECAEFYEPATWMQDRTVTCNDDGTWADYPGIPCRPICGKSGGLEPQRSTLIHRGTKANRGQWPWHAGLYRRNTVSEPFDYRCGGTLISDQLVLTASHCITETPSAPTVMDERNLKVFVGKHYRNLDENDQHVQSREVAKIYRHYKYSTETVEADIAVLYLKNPVQLTSYVRPICYPKEKRFSILFPGKTGIIVGWGTNEKNTLPNDLFMASFPVAPTDECVEFYGLPPQMENTTYCAGYRNGTSVCHGDSGGGMVLPAADRRWYLEGVVSFGELLDDGITCNSNEYSVFTRVSSYLDWIRGVVADASKDDYDTVPAALISG